METRKILAEMAIGAILVVAIIAISYLAIAIFA